MFRISSAIASSSTFTHLVLRPLFRKDYLLRLSHRSAWRRAPYHSGLVQVANIGRDPEGKRELSHITGNGEENATAQVLNNEEKAEAKLQAEKEALWHAREARVVPNTHKDLLDFFLTTEEQEMEFEVARCRPRLTEDFLTFLDSERGKLSSAVNKTSVEDMMAELELLEKSLQERMEAHDKLTADPTCAKERLLQIFCSRNKSKTFLEMAEKNEIDRPLLALLDENTAIALRTNEDQAAAFMEEIRGAVVKYIAL